MPGRAAPRLLALAVGAALVLASARPAGAEPPSPTPSVAPRVQVILVGALGDDLALAALVREWLEGSDLAPSVTRAERLDLAELRVPGPDGAPVRLWLVPVGGERARLYVAEPRARRYFSRDVPIPAGLDEVGREHVAQVVLSSTLAFLAGTASVPLEQVERAWIDDGAHRPAPAGATSTTASAAAPAPPPPPAPTPRRDAAAPTAQIGLGGLYGVADGGAAGLATGPGLLLELATTLGRVRVGGQLEGAYRLPREVPTEHLTLELRGATACAAAEACAALHPRVCWRLAAGAGVTVTEVVPTPRGGAAVTTVARDRASAAVLRVAIGPEWHRAGARAGLGAHLDVTPVGLRYELVDGAARRSELVLPRVAAGLAISIGLERPLGARGAAATGAGLAAAAGHPEQSHQQTRAR